ncbi:MAG TPA: aldo/keto reductase [Chroococcales cyanobacterium]
MNRLGQTDLLVSRLCFGTLTIGPFQRNLPVAEGAGIIREAFERGVNFFDTAEIYENYPYLKEGLKKIRDRAIIATKTYAYTREMAEKSLRLALEGLGSDHVDLFLLHEQESEDTIRGHREAFEYLLEAKEKGFVRAVGISTHSVKGVLGALSFPEIEVIHPLFNRDGLGILDGGAEEMLAAIRAAHKAGKGIYSMKALGGGHLSGEASEALSFVLEKPEISSIAVGIGDRNDLDDTLSIFEGKQPPLRQGRQRSLSIEDYCRGCGACVAACPQGALALREGKAVLVGECVLCSYCARVCPDFCLKVF